MNNTYEVWKLDPYGLGCWRVIVKGAKPKVLVKCGRNKALAQQIVSDHELRPLFDLQYKREVEVFSRWREEGKLGALQQPDYGYTIDTLLTENATLSKHLYNLLAIIHRDGGHYTQSHRLEKSVEDAHQVWADLQEAADKLSYIQTRGNYKLPCDRCGAPHMVDTSIHSEVWNIIVERGEKGDRWSLLCTTCIAELCKQYNTPTVAHFYTAHEYLVSAPYPNE